MAAATANDLALPGWKTLEAPMDKRWPQHRSYLCDPIPRINTPQSVHAWVTQQIKYKTDVGGDYWQIPEMTLARGKGDCEDMALLMRALLKVSHYQAYIWFLIIYDQVMRQQHAVLIVNDLVLDPLAPLVFPVSKLADYRPIIAFRNNTALTFGHPVKD
jgi:predicted transglutaminase-like cysteine proteinase